MPDAARNRTNQRRTTSHSTNATAICTTPKVTSWADANGLLLINSVHAAKKEDDTTANHDEKERRTYYANVRRRLQD
jgi:hypothetical protein